MQDSKDNLISKFSAFFVSRFRITLLLFFAILGIGFFSYFKLLPREGLPEIAFPVAIVQTPYFAGNSAEVDQKVTTPIENVLKNVEGINEVRSTTTENYSFSLVFFETDYTTEEGVENIEKEFDRDLELPEGTALSVEGLKTTYDGKHDVLLALTSSNISEDYPSDKLQERAQYLASKLEEMKIVTQANSIDLITRQENPLTGESFDYQSTFNRIGRVSDQDLKFQNSIIVGVIKDKDVNTIEFSDGIREKIDNLKESNELDGFDVVYIADFREDLDTQIQSLESNALSALVAVVVILLLFVNWRASIVTAIFIPTVMAATFIGMFLVGFTINIISLFALILVLGLFVDDAIVVVESIDYHKKQGKKGLAAIKEGILTIGVADIAGSVTTLIVFVPMLAITGILGEYIAPIPLTVIIALTFSLLIALTVIPFFSYILIPDKKEKYDQNKAKALVDVVLNGFSRQVLRAGEKVSFVVGYYLSRKVLTVMVVVVSLVLILAGTSFAARLKFSIFPPQKDSNGVFVTLNYNPGFDIETKKDAVLEVEKVIETNYEEYVTQIKYLQVGRDFFGNDTAEIWVVLNDMSNRDITSVEIADDLASKLEGIKTARVQVVEEQMGGSTEEFQFRTQIYADDQEKLVLVSAEIEKFIKSMELEGDVGIEEVITDNLYVVSKIDGKRYAEVLVKISDPTDSGAIIEIEDKVKNQFNNEKLSEYGLSDDVLGFDQGIESENMGSFNAAIFALLVALVLMYGLLVMQFNSFMQPFLILMAIPFGFVGLFPGLYLTNNALSFFVMLGVIALIGIVVNNTIILIDFAKQQRLKGMTVEESIVSAIKTRFRPLVTTSATTVAGLLPLALNDPFWESLAFTIVFGLIASTTMVIFVFPAYYVAIEKVSAKLGAVLSKIFKMKME